MSMTFGGDEMIPGNPCPCSRTIFCIPVQKYVYVCMLTLVSRRFQVLGEVSFCIRTLPNCKRQRAKSYYYMVLSKINVTKYKSYHCNSYALGKTGFQVEGSDLIHFIMEDRFRHASGPVHISGIHYKNT